MLRKTFGLGFLLLLFSIGMSFLVVRVSASSNLFVDDFEDGNDVGWTRKHYLGPDTLNQWQLVGGMYGMSISTYNTVGQSTVGDPSWIDYEYDLEMKTIEGADKNFIFRYNENYKGIKDVWYEVHVSNSSLYLTKAGAGTFQDPNKSFVWPLSSNYLVQNNKYYYWRTLVVGNHIQIFVREENELDETKVFDILDDNEPYMQGGVGIRIGTGAVAPNTIYFDNVRVTDLTVTPTPTPTQIPMPTPTPLPYLDVPFYSQNDPSWGQDEYDSASEWSKSNSTMDRWACALTSGTMILNFHKFDKGPDGQETNPKNMNSYFKENNLYTSNGGVVWSGFASYAAKAIENKQVASDSGELEFSYHAYTEDELKSQIEATQPAVLQIVTNDKGTPETSDDWIHFVVGKGVKTDKDIYINDPEESTGGADLLSYNYKNKTIRQIGEFELSHTDLSYIWLYVYDPNVSLLVEYSGLKTGEDVNGIKYMEIPGALYYAEGVINDPFNPTDTDVKGAKVFVLPKPSNGSYLLTLNGEFDTNTSMDAFLFNSFGDHQTYTQFIDLNGGLEQTYEINFNPESITFDPPERTTSFESLLRLVSYHYQHHNLKSTIAYRLITTQILLEERLYQRRPKLTKGLFKATKNLLLVTNKKHLLTDNAYNQILDEIEVLVRDLE